MSIMFSKKNKKPTKNEPSNDEQEHDETEPVEKGSLGDILNMSQEMRTIGLFGAVEEEKIADLIALVMLLSQPKKQEQEEDDEEEEVSEIKPIDFIISTPGGNADDMFALYDVMRIHRDKCPIHTFGLGKVMSAGVLLLAAGTKGQRKIGKNCRVMIHSVIGGNAGSFHNLENEMEEIRYILTAYLKALADETDMSYNQLRKMIDKKVNVYLSAEEAVKLGIADIIV